jgi:hypothetical protein
MITTNKVKVLFHCPDIELLKDFDNYCLDHRMSRSSMLRKFMYETVGKYKNYEIGKYFKHRQNQTS